MTTPPLPDVIAAEMRVLDPLLAAQQLLGLIEGAARLGILAGLADGASIDELGEVARLDPDVLAAVLDALVEGGVVEAAGEAFRLTDDWRRVCSTGGMRPLAATLAGERVRAELIRNTGRDEDYWSMPVADRVAVATSLSPDPIQGTLVPTFPVAAAAGAPLPAAASVARRYLELGCGAAGATLSMLQAFPQLHVVGVELSGDLADEAERRANVLGLQDRFTVVRGDAADFHDDEPFDVGFWSQFFFPEASRDGALRTLRSSVRSGGLVAAPVVHATGEEPVAVRQRASLLRVTTQSWGVPDRTPDELVDEFRASGFTDAHVTGQGHRSLLVVATGP